MVRDILMLNRMGSGHPDGQVRGTVFHRQDTCPDFGYRLREVFRRENCCPDGNNWSFTSLRRNTGCPDSC